MCKNKNSDLKKNINEKKGRFCIGNRVGFVGWMVGWTVGRLDGWMVKKFSSTLRIEVDPKPEVREVKPRSTRK